MNATTVASDPATELPPTAEVVEAILKWSERDRRDLAMLLIESVDRGLTEAEVAQKQLIQSRLDELVNGGELVEPEEVFTELRRRLAEVRKR
ncbi:MAG: hypothetical protein U0791_25435 [Gemmataceae bacterium]